MLYLVIRACLYSKDLSVEVLMTFSGWPIINVRSKPWDILAVYAWIDRDVGYFVKVGDSKGCLI